MPYRVILSGETLRPNADGYKLRPLRWSHSALMGPATAEIEVLAGPDLLDDCFQWLAHSLTISDDEGVVWGGYVSEVEVSHHGASRRASVESLVNSSTIVYSQRATNELQTITITGGPTGGTFSINFLNNITAGIAYNASAATVQAALEALGNVEVGDVTCTGGPLPGTPVVSEFKGQFAATNITQMLPNSALLTGGASPTATVTTPRQGTPALAGSVNSTSADSQTLYGIHEEIVTLQNATSAMAAAYATARVAALKYPPITMTPTPGKTGARLFCRGHILASRWRYYTSTDNTDRDLSAVVSTILTATNPYIVGVAIDNTFGINGQLAADGRRRAYDMLGPILELGNGATRFGLDIGYNEPSNDYHMARLRALPLVTDEPEYMLLGDGTITNQYGATISPSKLRAGFWVFARDIPLPAAAYPASFAESGMFDAVRGIWTWTPAAAENLFRGMAITRG